MAVAGKVAVQKLDPRVRAAAEVLRRDQTDHDGAELASMYESEFNDLVHLVTAMLAAADAAASDRRQ